MTGMDFFSAIYRNGIDLPIRVFLEGNHPNLFRKYGLTFCDLTLEDGDEIVPGKFDLLEGMDVSIVADSVCDKVRELSKAIVASRPRHLVVCAGDTFISWAAHRGWK